MYLNRLGIRPGLLASVGGTSMKRAVRQLVAYSSTVYRPFMASRSCP